MKTAHNPQTGRDVELTIRRADFTYNDGVARWVIPEDALGGNAVGSWIHEELADLEQALEDVSDGEEASPEGIQVMAVELAVWRLHNRRDRAPYPVVSDDGTPCVMITEQQLDEIIAEANAIIEDL